MEQLLAATIVFTLTSIIFAALVSVSEEITFWEALLFPAITFIYVAAMIWIITSLYGILPAFILGVIILCMFMLLSYMLSKLKYGEWSKGNPPIYLEENVE